MIDYFILPYNCMTDNDTGSDMIGSDKMNFPKISFDISFKLR